MESKNKSLKITGLIITAGYSSRMKSFKPLLEFKGESFLTAICKKLMLICSDIIIVTGYNESEINYAVENFFSENELLRDRIRAKQNENYSSGMFASLQCGLSDTEADWAIYHFVDQPSLPENFYIEFINQIDETHSWIQPARANRKGHPILLRNDLFKPIVESSIKMDLRNFSENDSVKKKFWECGFGEIFDDIDTEDDYARLIERG